jgi:hypothetical protein
MDEVDGAIGKRLRVFGAAMNLKLSRTSGMAKFRRWSTYLNVRGNAVLVSHRHLLPDIEKM